MTYQEAMKDAHAQADAACARYNAAKSSNDRKAAVEAIRAAELACAKAYDRWEVQP